MPPPSTQLCALLHTRAGCSGASLTPVFKHAHLHWEQAMAGHLAQHRTSIKGRDSKRYWPQPAESQDLHTEGKLHGQTVLSHKVQAETFATNASLPGSSEECKHPQNVADVQWCRASSTCNHKAGRWLFSHP